jgi:chaperonin GroES
MAKTKKKIKTKIKTKKKTVAPKTAAAKTATPKKVHPKAVGKKVAKKPSKMKPVKAKASPVALKPVKSAQAPNSRSLLTPLLLTPLEDRIVVERLEASDRTPGGLYIPDMAQERPSKGKVVAVGHGKRDKKGRVLPLDVKIGDLVLFTQWAGGEIQVDGSTFLIMRESDVLGVSNT